MAPNAPTATPKPPVTACVDGMAWVADLTFDDKNMTSPPVIPPGQSFTKSWRVRNSGTCTWDSRYVLAYDHGNVPAAQMGGQPVAVRGTVAPGQTYDFSVNLTAPTTPGVYQGFWQMRNPAGTPFGETHLGRHPCACAAAAHRCADTDACSQHQLHRQLDQHQPGPVRHLPVERYQRPGCLLLRGRPELAKQRRGRSGQQHPVPDANHHLLPESGAERRHR